MQNRQNICPETAVIKASERLFGVQLTFQPQANNDVQCELGTLFKKTPGQDIFIANPAFGGQRAALAAAHNRAYERAQREGVSQARFEQYKTDETAAILHPIRQAMAMELEKLTPPNVYMLRTGTENGGHWQTVYYVAPNWILDSGFDNGRPNIGILYRTDTRQLGPMAEQSLMDPSSIWGQGFGQRMLAFFEMNPTRTLIAASYIEKFRELNTDDADMFFATEDYVNDIIARPNYLSSFGRGHYWQAQSNGQRYIPECSADTYIRIAEDQCLRQGLTGAVAQLHSRDYFSDPMQGSALLAEALRADQLPIVKVILDNNLVTVTAPNQARMLYQAAQEVSQGNPASPPGLRPSLRALQNKLLQSMDQQNLPFTLEDVCAELNIEPMETILSTENDTGIDYDHLRSVVIEAAGRCQSGISTYGPLLSAIDQHERQTHTAVRKETSGTMHAGSFHHHATPQNRSSATTDAARAAIHAPPKHAKGAEPALHQSTHGDNEKKKADSPIPVARLPHRMQPRPVRPMSPFETELTALTKSEDIGPQEAWEHACHALCHREPYVGSEADKNKVGSRAIEYNAQAEGRIITKIIPEREQILLDDLFAKKLEAESRYKPR